MQCELCGNESGEGCKPALIEGVKMYLCPSCIKHGESVKETHGTPTHVHQSLVRRSRRRREKDVYEKMRIELVSDWADKIKKARKKKDITREKLGFNIGERTVTISKIENGELRPSDDIAKKLEKELNIILFEEVKKTDIKTTTSHSSGLTLADFIKKEE